MGEEKSLYIPEVEELVAIGASIACNCEKCLRYHINKAKQLGVSESDMLSAVYTANSVKNTPAKAILTLANTLLMKIDSGKQDQNDNGEIRGCDCGCNK
jgi:AhpD family alkylhydroperoxidase